MLLGLNGLKTTYKSTGIDQVTTLPLIFQPAFEIPKTTAQATLRSRQMLMPEADAKGGKLARWHDGAD
jgi:hypothetical protein